LRVEGGGFGGSASFCFGARYFTIGPDPLLPGFGGSESFCFGARYFTIGACYFTIGPDPLPPSPESEHGLGFRV
jgi:hypothetical protein